MFLTTSKLDAKSAAERWKYQYYIELDNKWRDQKREDIYNRLIELGENPTPNQVNEVIGNNSWTLIICMVCKKSVKKAITFVDGDNFSHDICKKCLNKSLKLFKENNS